jgi:hypothetical protein
VGGRAESECQSGRAESGRQADDPAAVDRRAEGRAVADQVGDAVDDPAAVRRAVAVRAAAVAAAGDPTEDGLADVQPCDSAGLSHALPGAGASP